MFSERQFIKTVANTMGQLQNPKKNSDGYEFLDKFEFTTSQVHRIMMKVNPSPTGTCE